MPREVRWGEMDGAEQCRLTKLWVTEKENRPVCA